MRNCGCGTADAAKLNSADKSVILKFVIPNPPSAIHAPGPPRYFLMRHLRAVAREPLRFYTKFWREHGDIVRVHWRGQQYLTICVAPAAVERVLGANWSNYPKGFFYKRVGVFTGNGLFTSEGDFWLQQRRLSQPAFARARIEKLAAPMSECAAQLSQEWAQLPAAEPLEIEGEMKRLTLQIAARTLFGVDLRGAQAELFHHRVNTAMAHVTHRFNPVSLPERVPTRRNREFLRIKNELHRWILGLAQTRRDQSAKTDDLLQLLVDARDETGAPMSETQLADEMITLLVAGYETTTTALSWSLYLLARNPDARAELEAEAAQLNGRAPTYRDLEGLPWARQVFQEALRLYPPVWAITREAKCEDEIGGYAIAAGGNVLLPQYLTHRHPAFWPDPERFDPNRWAPQEIEKRPRFAAYPFGGGPRLCIGQGFALMEAQLILSTLAARWRLDLVPGLEQGRELNTGLVLRPKRGLWMTRREII